MDTTDMTKLVSVDRKYLAWPRTCLVCETLHQTPSDAKGDEGLGYYCTWCSDTAPPLPPNKVA